MNSLCLDWFTFTRVSSVKFAGKSDSCDYKALFRSVFIALGGRAVLSMCSSHVCESVCWVQDALFSAGIQFTGKPVSWGCLCELETSSPTLGKFHHSSYSSHVSKRLWCQSITELIWWHLRDCKIRFARQCPLGWRFLICPACAQMLKVASNLCYLSLVQI